MSPERKASEYLKDILNSARLCEEFLAGLTYEQFVTDIRTQYAVVRALEIVGEATKNLSMELRNSNSDVPWKLMTGMRDRLIHGYIDIDLTLVWNTVTKELPEVVPKIESVLKNMRDAAQSE